MPFNHSVYRRPAFLHTFRNPVCHSRAFAVVATHLGSRTKARSRLRQQGSKMWITKMVRAGVVICGSHVQRPLRAVFLQRCSAPHFTFLNSLHPVSLANPSSALREPIHKMHSNCPPLSFATLAIVCRYHARQVFAQKA
jgi:hypothetical protein